MRHRPDWVEPILEWCDGRDTAALQERLSRDGEFLSVVPAQPTEAVPTHWYRLDGDYWISQRDVGAIRFKPSEPHVAAFPSLSVEPAWFHQVVTRAWLPTLYPFWRRQVIHASAVARADTLHAILFTGQTHAGKSTTAYGMARRPGWQLLTDDTLGFSWESDAVTPRLLLHPLHNEVRLRPASAEFFGRPGQQVESVIWPSGGIRVVGIYFLDGADEGSEEPEFTRLRMAEAYPILLQQAYALSFELPIYNQQLMMDYAQLAAAVPVFRLRYRRSFALASALYGAIDAHIGRELIT